MLEKTSGREVQGLGRVGQVMGNEEDALELGRCGCAAAGGDRIL